MSEGVTADAVRVTAWVRGRVQGVGMRWWIRSRALELGLVGWARNLEDGRVEIVAEGPVESVAALIGTLRGATTGTLRGGEPPGRVEGVTERRSAARGDLEGFRER